MNLLRRVLLIGVVSTLVDVGLLLVLVASAGWPVPAADAVAVALATVLSFLLHTGRTGELDSPGRRWFNETGPYWLTALLALLVDVVVLSLLDAVFDPRSRWALGVCKVVSLGAAFFVRSSNYRSLMFRAVRQDQAEPARRREPSGELRLSVVVPAYEEADRIGATIERIRDRLHPMGEESEIIVVDDGSSDGTAQAARVAGADVVVSHPVNHGKGAAVRDGMLAARGRTVAFTDADLSYDPRQILRLVEAVEAGWDVVVGSRRHTNTMTVVRAGRLRELGGRIVNVFTGVVLLGRYRDTQCGLKGFRRDVGQLLFNHCHIEGFAFDVEVFHLVERYRLTLVELPVEVQNTERSTVHVVRDSFKLLRDLLRIRNLARSGAYDIDHVDLPPPAPPAAGGRGGPGLGLASMSRLDDIFKAYDVRGTVPDQLDDEVAEAIGAGFARFARSASDPSPSRVLVARDMRPSGVALVDAFCAGVTSVGVDVVDLGLASTDLLYFAAGHLDAPGAMFTASHNPAGYNGAKFCLAGARPVGEDSGLDRIKAFAEERLAAGSRDVPEGVTGNGVRSSADLLDAFAEHVRSFVDVTALRSLHVVADTANGMGGLVVPAVFEPLPFRLELMYGELDGTFPNHPADPIQPENTEDLRARVVQAGADIGLAFDGDADRVFLVDERGIGLSGSTTTAIIAAGILAQHRGETVIHNLICSKAVPEVVREHGGTPVRTRVGHSFIKEVMADTGAIFGGEHSAHYYFRDNYRADSGLIAALVVLEQMSTSGKALSELRVPFERYAASGEINTRVEDPAKVIERVAAVYDRDGFTQDRTDGLTVDGGDWWFNLRASNTEPLLRLNLEAADDPSCAARVAEVRSIMAS